jgi:hypothetical protein
MYYYFFIDEKYKKYIHRYDTQTTHIHYRILLHIHLRFYLERHCHRLASQSIETCSF